MDPAQNPQQAGSGMVFGSAPPPAQGQPPQSGGMVFSNTPPSPPGQQGPPPVHNDELHLNDNKSWYSPENLARGVGSAFEGVGEGVFSTLAGGADLLNRGAQYVHDKAVSPQLHDVVQGHRDQVHLIPEGATQELHKLAGDENTPGSSNVYNKVGYGGETLAEFMAGDEALKSLTMADKALTVGKTLKVLEKSPRLMTALKAGAKVLAEQSARAGVVQGAQTLVRSGGDLDAAAKATVEGAGTTAILGGALGTAGHFASKLGDAGEAAGKLADMAANAPDKQTVAENIQGQLLNAKNALHEGYETGITDITNRLGDNSVEVKGSPLANKAKALLAEPNPEDHALVQQAKEATGNHLDKDVKGLLENLANGTKPLTEEEIEAAKTASKPSGLVDASGQPLKATPVEPTPSPAKPLTGHDIVQLRQEIRKMADGYQYGDINARALRSLLWDGATHSSAFDDTMDQIAAKSGDPTAVSDYKALRNNYRAKINIYDNPVISNLMEGKVDDAAKAFVGTKSASGLPTAGKTEFNVEQLKTVLGDDGFTHFRNQVFDNMMKTASDSNGFNPAKFMSTWNRIADGTKSDLFGATNPTVAPQNYVNAIVDDAKTAANMQKLVRAGLVLGAGAGAGTVSPVVGAGLSTVLAFIAGHEGAGGVAKGRELLDYVANHPRTWATLRGVGRASASAPAQAVGTLIPKAGQAAVNINSGSDTRDSQAKVFQSLAPALSGAPANPNQGSGSKVADSPVYVTPSFPDGKAPGLETPGNIDLNTRPDIKNLDGSHSSVFSMTFGTDNGGGVLVPGVGDGKTYPARQLRVLYTLPNGTKQWEVPGNQPKSWKAPKSPTAANNEAYDQFQKTGKNLGTFKSEDAADAYGQKLHEDQAKMRVVNGKLTAR